MPGASGVVLIAHGPQLGSPARQIERCVRCAGEADDVLQVASSEVAESGLVGPVIASNAYVVRARTTVSTSPRTCDAPFVLAGLRPVPDPRARHARDCPSLPRVAAAKATARTSA